jgi:hypothetical protein
VSKASLVTKIPDVYNVQAITELFRQVEVLLNNLAENKIVAKYNARPTIPTTGSYKQGDFVPNSTPSQLGAPGSRYVLLGWICTVSGEPGTLLECRVLTGN